jgi:uncharacterized membrane protein
MEAVKLEELLQSIESLDERIRVLERAAQIASPPPTLRAVHPSPLPQPHPIVTPLAMDFPEAQAVRIPAAISRPIEHSPDSHDDLEATIGQHWAGWIGAIVFVLGMLFFLKYAWDQGWINPTPTARIVATIIVGAALSAAGEWMHRRKIKALAAILHGAGLAIVMASFFASYALFDPAQRVLGVGGAFAGVIATAAIGIALSLRIDSISLASIALIGAYLAPFVLNTGEDHTPQLLAYLGVLSAVGLTLSYFRPRWFAIRALAWVGTFASFAIWWNHLGQHAAHQSLASLWLGFFYFAFLLEMILTLRKSNSANAVNQTSVTVLSLLNTAATFALIRAIYPQSSFDATLGVIAFGLAVVQAIAALLVRSREFSFCSLLQSAALVTLAVPLILNHFAITMAWIALAVALATLAWQLNLPAARGWATLLLLLSIARLFLFDETHLRGIAYSIGSTSISQWMLLAWATAILAHLIAWLRPISPGKIPAIEQRFAQMIPTTSSGASTRILNYAVPTAPQASLDPLGIFISIIGSILFMAASVTQFSGSTLTLLGLLWLVPLIALSGVGRHLGYMQHAIVLTAIVSLKWFAVDGLEPLVMHWDRPVAALPPLLNMVAFNGAGLCALLAVVLVQLRRESSSNAFAVAMWLALVVLSLLNFETWRTVDWMALHGVAMDDPAIVKQVAMSVLWASTGFAAILVGFRRGIALLRYAALALLGVTLLKILIIDMAQVEAVWRILSFIALGGVLLCVSYLYQREVAAE